MQIKFAVRDDYSCETNMGHGQGRDQHQGEGPELQEQAVQQQRPAQPHQAEDARVRPGDGVRAQGQGLQARAGGQGEDRAQGEAEGEGQEGGQGFGEFSI